MRVLVNHLQVCPMLGRNSAPHAVRDVLSHLVVQNGVTDAAVVETRLTVHPAFPSFKSWCDRKQLEVHTTTRGLECQAGQRPWRE